MSRQRLKSSAVRRFQRLLINGMLGVLVLFLALVTIDGWKAFGKRADPVRQAKKEQSPQWHADGHFKNPEPLQNDGWAMLTGFFGRSPHASPSVTLNTLRVDRKRFETPPATALRVTWFGHSSLLVEIDGHRILTDPVWGKRASPLDWLGPERWYAPPIALADLPTLDAVVISHDHYDHLDYPTISAMKDWKTTFIVPLGVGAHLAYWGVPESRIVELDWWGRIRIRGLEIVCTPARHASGRVLYDNNTTLWAGYALLGSKHRVFFSGDTGLFPALNDIGARLGPFDLTLIEAGAYNSAWPDWHLGPEQAVTAHQMVRGRVLLPIHWGLFNLAYHGWTEPIERVLAAAESVGVSVLTPKPGQSLEPEGPATPKERWWPALAWKSGKEDPIVATKMH